MSNVPTSYVPRTERMTKQLNGSKTMKFDQRVYIPRATHKHGDLSPDHGEGFAFCAKCSCIHHQNYQDCNGLRTSLNEVLVGAETVGATVRAALHPGPITMTEPSALAHQEGGDHYKNLKIQPIEMQPDPVPNDKPAVWPLVMVDMASRDNLGRKRYGTALQPFNGRDNLRDAYEEALDLAVYLRAAIYERDGK